MSLTVLIVALALAAAILVATVILYYTTQRMTRVWTFLLAVIVTVPCLVIALIGLFSAESDATTRMWSLGICGLLVGYWFKNPFQVLRD